MSFKLSTKGLVTIAVSWPSLGILAGSGLGALPFGAAVLSGFGVRFRLSQWIFALLWFSICLGYFVAFPFGSVKDFVGLLAMPLFFLLMVRYFSYLVRSVANWTVLRSTILFFLFILLIEGLVSAFLFGTGARSKVVTTLEPSHSARLFFSLFMLLCVVNRPRLSYCFLAAGFVLVNKSASSVMFFIFTITLLFIQYAPAKLIVRYLFSILFIFFLSIFVVSLLPPGWGNGHRGLSFLESLFNLQLTDITRLVAILGGARLISDYVTYSGSEFLGHGIGSNSILVDSLVTVEVLDTSAGQYVDNTIGFSASSFGAQVSFDMGLSTLLLLFIFTFPLKFRTFVSLYVWAFAWFQILVYSSTTMITPWFFLALSYVLQRRRFLSS